MCDLDLNYISDDAITIPKFLKWMTGSKTIPPLGLPKKIAMSFLHSCPVGCKCRPAASTCDIRCTIPVHIASEEFMKEMLVSALDDSYGFGLI